MKHLQRLDRFWGWLPAFRAVAETEHLPEAGEHLGVSPPALSRAIKLLERDLGHELFHRKGRKLRLNPRGQALLRSLRQAMRNVGETVESFPTGALHGTVPIVALGVATTARLLPALQRLKRDHPGFLPSISSDAGQLTKRLLRAEVELSLQSEALHHPELETVHLGSEKSSVYCAADHPLAGVGAPTLSQVCAHEFLGPPPDPMGRVPDFWPAEHPRRIGLHVDQMRLGRDACRETGLLAVLPDAVARGSDLVRIALDDVLPPTQVFATFRAGLDEVEPARIIIAAVRVAEDAGQREGAAEAELR